MDRFITIAKVNNKYAEYVKLKHQLDLFHMNVMNNDPNLEELLQQLEKEFETHFPKNKKDYRPIIKECKLIMKSIHIKNKFI